MIHLNKSVYGVCGFSAIGGGLFGLDIASMSGVLGTSAYNHFFHYPRSYIQGGITASMPLGSIFGSLASSFISDRFSRKVAIQVACLLWIIGSAIQSASNGIPALCVGRAISGVGVGMASTVVPVYQAEIAPKETRGRVITLQQFAITLGIMVQFFVEFGCSTIDKGANNDAQGTAAFRLPWGLQMIPGWVLFFGMFWMPHSPRWLASKDRWDEAINILADLHAGGNINHPKVLAQYREIEEALRFEMQARAAGWGALLAPNMAKRVFLGMSVQMWSELCGMNVMVSLWPSYTGFGANIPRMYYIVYIMQSANIGSPLFAASSQYVINAMMTVPAILWIDTWGRRPTLLLGAFGMGSFLFVSGALQATYGELNNTARFASDEVTWVILNNKPVSQAVIACSCLFVAVFATSWGPVSWMYPAEIFPNRIRAKATSLTTSMNWIANCVLAFAVPPLMHNINWKMFMIFGTFNFLAMIQVYFTVPETTNLTLEEMDIVFQGRPWARKPKVSGITDVEMQIERGSLKVDVPKPKEHQSRKP
ncbi:general substrate transporter [Lepidopterella palustris CBS 459.81]|uniref:General substrate transporter n=1 Tax=Lepidopterella palustris CBS 459.81 TaxID=1314670 RepID=A0A8E2JIV7_9PEZI|nr:general substrate transporter [Lepidopterella palustris CBS 459.81]